MQSVKRSAISGAVFFLASVLIFMVCAGENEADVSAEPSASQLDRISLPPGFSISIYADNVRGARSMALSPDGTLFVGSMRGNLYAVRDNDDDYTADEVITIATGLNEPNGVEFRDGSLYVAEMHRIVRYDDIQSRLYDPPEPVVLNQEFPSHEHHGWKYLRIGPDDKLYFNNGAPCNICEPPGEQFASLLRMNRDGSGLEVFAHGVRQSVGFDWDPRTGDFWFTDNGGDNLGDEIPPDELNHAPAAGLHFGYPYYYGRNEPYPAFENMRDADDFTPVAMPLAPHTAAIGMRFYSGAMFPDEYKNAIFIAEHGSWNRSPGVPHNGYRVTVVKVANNEAVSYEPFAEGWLLEDGRRRFGRPVDIHVMPDGSLLVSDDFAGVIYRITYDL